MYKRQIGESGQVDFFYNEVWADEADFTNLKAILYENGVYGNSVSYTHLSTNGTITDIDGNFSLSVSANSTLTVSFVGYKTQTISVNGKTSDVYKRQAILPPTPPVPAMRYFII